MTSILVPVPRENIAAALETKEIADFLRRDPDIREGRVDYTDAVEDMLEGRKQLWLAIDDTEVLAACATSITGEICDIDMCGGEKIDRWIHLLDGIEDWAREQGCVESWIPNARKGWQKRLPGYKTKTVAMVKAL